MITRENRQKYKGQKNGNKSYFSSQLSFRCIAINRQFFDDFEDMRTAFILLEYVPAVLEGS